MLAHIKGLKRIPLKGAYAPSKVNGLSAAKDYLDVYAIGNRDPHELPQGTLISVEVDEPLVDPHLPTVPGLATLTVRTLPARYFQLLRGKWYRSTDLNPGLLGDSPDLGADAVDLLRVGSAE